MRGPAYGRARSPGRASGCGDMTIWPFQNVVCFSVPYYRNFVAPRCSTAYCLYCLSIIGLIAFPLFCTFASDNVWVKESFYHEQPVVSFAHDVFIVLAGDSTSDAVGWCTREDLQPLLPEHVVVPIVRSSSADIDHNGLPDSFRLQLEVPTGDVRKGFRHMFLMAVYNYELRERVREHLSGLLVVDIGSSFPATGVWIKGQVKLRQRQPLRIVAGEVRDLYAPNPLAIDFRSSWATFHNPLAIRDLLERYANRNETLHFEPAAPPVWDFSPRDYFEAELVMDVAPQLVYYVPGSLEVLKFGWVQVLSFIVPTWMVLRAVQAFAFENQIVETYVVPQPHPKAS